MATIIVGLAVIGALAWLLTIEARLATFAAQLAELEEDSEPELTDSEAEAAVAQVLADIDASADATAIRSREL